MEPEYKNWIPRERILGYGAGAALCAVGATAAALTEHRKTALLLGAGALGLGAATGWLAYAHSQFSYDGERQLSRDIVEGVAAYVHLPAGGLGLDVGCGSGALTIACAKANPQAQMIGVDLWGADARGSTQALCAENAAAEGISNAFFCPGDARQLPFPDGHFDLVTSNYVYHNVPTADRQALLRESLRVLKKGGTFVLHDLMTPARYGDMNAFIAALQAEGYTQVGLISTANGLFMEATEAALLMLSGSTLLTGKK